MIRIRISFTWMVCFYVFYNGDTETEDKRILRLSDSFIRPAKEGWTKCVAHGISQGKAQGIEEARLEIAADMLKDNYSLDTIINISKLPKEKILSIAESMGISVD